MNTLERYISESRNYDRLSRNEIRKFVQAVSRYIFRGYTPDVNYISSLSRTYQKLLSQRFSNDYALKELVSTMLSSPSFLYISDSVISKNAKITNSVEFANRLAYLLWSSPLTTPCLLKHLKANYQTMANCVMSFFV